MLSRIFRLFNLLQERTARQFMRFAVVGATNTVLDFGVYIALTRGTEWFDQRHVTAAVASFCVAATSSFLLNNFWTFSQDGNGWEKRAPKFFAVAVGGLVWNALLLSILLAVGLHDIMAKLIATGAVIAWNFTMQKKWTFGA